VELSHPAVPHVDTIDVGKLFILSATLILVRGDAPSGGQHYLPSVPSGPATGL
jgi:hypothetical protein